MSIGISNPFPIIMPEIPVDPQAEMLMGEFMEVDPDQFTEQKGSLQGEGKQYIVSPEGQGRVFSQAAQTFFSDGIQAKEKPPLDSKTMEGSTLSLADGTIKIKELKTSESQKPDLSAKEESSSSKQTTDKASRSMQFSLAMKAPTEKHTFISNGATRFAAHSNHSGQTAKTAPHQNNSSSLERKATLGEQGKVDSRKQENQPLPLSTTQQREGVREAPLARAKDYIKDEQQKERRHKQEDEEGSGEGEKQRQQQGPQNPEENEEHLKVNKTESISTERASAFDEFVNEFDKYAMEESILSQILNMRVSHLDVLSIFIEILKLEIRSREQERISRMQERELQLLHMENIIENYKSQGRFLLFANLGAGVLGIASGASPIVGHVGGKWILDKLSGVFSSLQNANKNQFFKSVRDMTHAMSEMQRSTGQIQQSFAESERTRDEHMSTIHRTDYDENTRTLEEIKDFWKNIENFLFETLRMIHEAIRQLYNM